MSLSEISVKRPVATTMVFIALVAIGGFAFTRLKVDFMPEIDFPSISIVTNYAGVGPEEIENLITRPIEQAVSTVQGVESIESYSLEGRSRITMRFVWGTDLDVAMSDVRAFVERAKAQLPEDAEAPVVFKFSLASFPVMQLTVSGELEESQLRRMADDVVRYRLERLPGVASVDVRGGRHREVMVELFPDQLAHYGITTTEVVEAIRRERQHPVVRSTGTRHVAALDWCLRVRGRLAQSDCSSR
jgi:HAE1 family hydrophobic/amphiphilic exporter-1